MIKLTELKLNKIRKQIPINIDGEEKLITIYNPIGKKREQILKLLETGNKLSDKEVAADMLYKSILKELVDIDVDLKSSKGLLKAPTMQLLELNYEIDEILHEIQYEFITGQIRQLNANRIAAMATVSINKVKQLQEDMDKLNGNV